MKVLKDFLSNKDIMSLAVISQDLPWVATLFFAEDENLNLIFISGKGTQHSKAIENDDSVAVSIYDHSSDPEGKKIGVQISGKCHKITNPLEIKSAYTTFRKKFPDTKVKLTDILETAFRSAFYKVEVEYVKYFNSELDPKIQEFSLRNLP